MLKSMRNQNKNSKKPRLDSNVEEVGDQSMVVEAKEGKC